MLEYHQMRLYIHSVSSEKIYFRWSFEDNLLKTLFVGHDLSLFVRVQKKFTQMNLSHGDFFQLIIKEIQLI